MRHTADQSTHTSPRGSDPANLKNPSGQDRLGEPKFNIESSAFTNPQVCSQRRVSSAFCNLKSESKPNRGRIKSNCMMQFAEWLLKIGNSTYVEKKWYHPTGSRLCYSLLEATDVRRFSTPSFLSNRIRTNLTSGNISIRNRFLPPLCNTDRVTKALWSP